MSLKAMVIAATAAVLAIATDGASAQTETHTRHVKSGTHGQHVAVAKHPPTRVIVTRRSYLDAGTEVLPGDRKFTDYAYPLGYNPNYHNGFDPVGATFYPLSNPFFPNWW